jgi:hypothetical protein
MSRSILMRTEKNDKQINGYIEIVYLRYYPTSAEIQIAPPAPFKSGYSMRRRIRLE